MRFLGDNLKAQITNFWIEAAPFIGAGTEFQTIYDKITV